MKSKKHIFKHDGYNIIIEHEKPFTRFTAIRQLKKHRINLRIIKD